RMDPGTTPDRAGSELLAMAQRIDSQRDRPSGPVRVEGESLPDAVVGNARPLLLVITAASALLLLIACGNVAGLLLMRAVRRSRDLTVRRALGASSGRIARGFVLEGAVIGVVAGGLGLLLA